MNGELDFTYLLALYGMPFVLLWCGMAVVLLAPGCVKAFGICPPILIAGAEAYAVALGQGDSFYRDHSDLATLFMTQVPVLSVVTLFLMVTWAVHALVMRSKEAAERADRVFTRAMIS